MELLVHHLGTAPVADALGAADSLCRAAVSGGNALTLSAVVEGRAVILGASQRARSVLDLDRCRSLGVTVYRRATTGAAGLVTARALWWTLCLPRINALYADATPLTVLNRNVRGYLKGLTRAGAPAHYLGRDSIVAERQPVALLGYDVDAEGTLRIDVMAGWDEGFELVDELRAEPERAVSPRQLRPAVALGARCSGRSPEEVARTVALAAIERAGSTVVEPDAATVSRTPAEPVLRPDDPAPEGVVTWGEARVPMGRVEAGTGPGVAWLGGDALVSSEWLRRAEAALLSGRDLPAGGVMLGARVEDFAAAWSSASVD